MRPVASGTPTTAGCRTHARRPRRGKFIPPISMTSAPAVRRAGSIRGRFDGAPDFSGSTARRPAPDHVRDPRAIPGDARRPRYGTVHRAQFRSRASVPSREARAVAWRRPCSARMSARRSTTVPRRSHRRSHDAAPAASERTHRRARRESPFGELRSTGATSMWPSAKTRHDLELRLAREDPEQPNPPRRKRRIGATRAVDARRERFDHRSASRAPRAKLHVRRSPYRQDGDSSRSREQMRRSSDQRFTPRSISASRDAHRRSRSRSSRCSSGRERACAVLGRELGGTPRLRASREGGSLRARGAIPRARVHLRRGVVRKPEDALQLARSRAPAEHAPASA